METAIDLTVEPLEDRYLKTVFEMEPGEADYYDWLLMVTEPTWQRYGIFKGGKLAGYLGLEHRPPSAMHFHVSLKRKTLKPSETRKVVIETGIYLFNHGIERLNTIHPWANKAACALANACGLALDTYIIKDHAPLCFHTLARETYRANQQRWEI